MRRRLVIAMAIGALASILLLAIMLLIPGSEAPQYLGTPGIITAMLVWGPHGPVPSDILFMALVLAVNAIVYGLAVLGILSVLKISN
jgi:hypothetical protein